MRVTVCELSNDPTTLAEQWEALAAHVRAERSDFLLLPEMPFHPWVPAGRQVDPAAWERAVAEHQRWLARLPELGTRMVLTTRPVIDGPGRFNQSVVWDDVEGELPFPHRKQYLPDEEGFWEASWYSRGGLGSVVAETHGVRIGFAICTELWFLHRARRYGRQGVQLLACPRATPAGTADKWVAGGRVAAVVSGAFCLSSNFSGDAAFGAWGGTGWVIEPENGTVLATTSPHAPFVTVEIDLRAADAAKSTYPRYVADVEDV